MSNNKRAHPDFFAAMAHVYSPSQWPCSEPLVEVESAEYGACMFELKGLKIKFRVAKITPTKAGQFVTLWKRIENGPIQPYDILDPIDFFVISVRYAFKQAHLTA